MTSHRVHAFGEDALGRHDAVGLARLLRRGELSRKEVFEAAAERARRVNGALHAIEFSSFEQPLCAVQGKPEAPFKDVPIFVKDTNDVAGWPTRFGSRAIAARPARRHDAVTRELLAQGFAVLGKTRLPEFGLSATTEPEEGDPTRNPWNPAHSSGGSSGGSAALVAAGVVPVAHGNDGGGSLRIPASCCGLVGLKLTRGRFATGDAARRMPVSIVTEGIMTRTVRDTAHFVAALEQRHRNLWLPSVGLVEGPSRKRLRIAVVFDSINDVRSCDETRGVVERVARLLETLGHRVETLVPPVPLFFLEDFKLYWGFLAFGLARFGKAQFAGFEPERLELFTKGLVRYYERRLWQTPLAMTRLRASSIPYARAFKAYDVVLSPVVTQTAPKLGHLHPQVPFEELFDRISKFTAFTPLNNAAGSPALALPASLSAAGLPLGIQLSATHAAERTLLELAYELEAELRFPRIDQA